MFEWERGQRIKSVSIFSFSIYLLNPFLKISFNLPFVLPQIDNIENIEMETKIKKLIIVYISYIVNTSISHECSNIITNNGVLCSVAQEMA